jgi:putative NADH-flavin reductase
MSTGRFSARRCPSNRGPHTGNYHLGTTTLLADEKGESRISVEDYAGALVKELESPAHSRSQMTITY